MCSWLYHGWVPETISGKPYTHHGCLETIPSLFSKSVPEYLDHLVVTRGGKLHTGKKGGMFWNKLDITPALLVIFLGDKLLESPLKKKKKSFWLLWKSGEFKRKQRQWYRKYCQLLLGILESKIRSNFIQSNANQRWLPHNLWVQLNTLNREPPAEAERLWIFWTCLPSQILVLSTGTPKLGNTSKTPEELPIR